MRVLKSVLLSLLTVVSACLAVIVTAPPASAAVAITSTNFGGGVAVSTAQGTTRYYRSGQPQTIFVFTNNEARCVELAGALTAKQTSTGPKTFWVFDTTTPVGEGTKAITAVASPGVNPQGSCTGNSTSTQMSYVLDNTGPGVSPNLFPAANANGWNGANTQLSWSTSDPNGVGVDPNTRPAPETFSTNAITTRSVTVTDYLGNSTTASTTVRVDKAAPTISATQTSGGLGQPTTVTFTCEDAGAQQSGIATCLAAGSATNSRTITGNGTVTGTATDRAGNTTSLPVQVLNVDTTAPLLSGSPTTSPNGNGWYAGNVTVDWTASDPESGISSQPADTTIAGEGVGLTSSTSVTNGAGLSTTATSNPSVKIDRTAPVTTLSGDPDAWTDGSVTLDLFADDNLSGVDRTVYAVDGGAPQTGSSVTLSTEGAHTVSFHSVDRAGNSEPSRTVHVRIDKTAPTITHRFTPTSYADGAWTNVPVTVTFECADQGGSGVGSCSGPATRTAEGEHVVVGTAADGAGNSATDHVLIRLDLTTPSVTHTVVGEKGEAGWYRAPVEVGFSCTDDLSGVVHCSEPVTLGEGRDQSATGTATDAAGNSGGDEVGGIDVDLTAPVLTASYSTDWHTDDVVVSWSCDDQLSGVDGPAETQTTVTGEGGDLSSSETCTDVAGNTVSKTVSGIRIDRHAPVTQASVPQTPGSGWYTADVEVTLSGSDDLSGVGSTVYSVDDGDTTAYTGPFTVHGDGLHTVRFHSVDRAGNVEDTPAPLTIDIDGAAPTTTVINPIVPGSGWYVTSGIPFAFEAADEHSGVASTYYAIDDGEPKTYGEPFTADLSDGQHHVTYWSVDNAGNVEPTQELDVNVDVTPPSIGGSQTPAANAQGWNNSDVEVTFTCDDGTSGLRTGVAGCAGDTTLTNEGDDQEVVGDAIDVAGNTASTTYGPVRIDKTAPTLTGVPTDANGAGWHRDDVTVTWTGDDGLSGIDPATQPAPGTVTGEGRGLGASASVKDRAGNSGQGSVTGIRIDRSAPTVSGQPTTAPNAAGWYSGDVVVDWTCAEPLLADGSEGSGVATCPISTLLKGDGAHQSATSGLPADAAGNTGDAATVSGINIDGSAPSTIADNQCSKTNGWCTGATATVVLTAVDQEGLSGVKEIHYRIDGGVEQVASSSAKTVSVPLDGSGEASVRYWAVDRAGNAEAANTVALKWDNIAPTVSHALDPAPNADEWNNSDVTVTFTAKDDDLGSGVASVSAPVTISGETAGQVVTGTAQDTAGNTGTDKVTVKLDRTRPTIAGQITAGTVGDDGWYVGPVTVSFTCGDALSGVVACPDPVVLTANGAANSATGTVVDRAGNVASATVSGVKIDRERPTLTAADVNVANGSYPLGTAPNPTCTGADSFSGMSSCVVTVTGGTANGVGTFAWTATARDRAGNITTITGTYTVIYRFDGFLQPINDTAHQVAVSTSMFKAGSTVPVKLQLKNAAGQVVQPVGAPDWLAPVKGSATSAPVNETAYAASMDSGTDYRYDPGARQWIYNWKTGSAAGSYWRIGVRLDDGQTYFVNIGLR